MALAHLVALLKKLLANIAAALDEAMALRRALARRYPPMEE